MREGADDDSDEEDDDFVAKDEDDVPEECDPRLHDGVTVLC